MFEHLHNPVKMCHVGWRKGKSVATLQASARVLATGMKATGTGNRLK